MPERREAVGEDDRLLRRDARDGAVVWFRGRPYNTHPSRRPERDEHLAAIDRNRNGMSQEQWNRLVAQEALRDFHSSGADEHLERLRAAWIDTPPEGEHPFDSIASRSLSRGLNARKPETWAPYSNTWAGGESRQRLAQERLRTLNDLRRRADGHFPQGRYDNRAAASWLPLESGSRPRTPSEALGRGEWVPVRNHHGKIIAWQPQPPSLDFNAEMPERREHGVHLRSDHLPRDAWDTWQRRWHRDFRRGELQGWGDAALRPPSPVAEQRRMRAKDAECTSIPGSPMSSRSTAASSCCTTPTRAGRLRSTPKNERLFSPAM